MEKILVSGSSGFIGKNLCHELIKLNRSVVGTVRNLNSIENKNNFEKFLIENISLSTEWKNALKDVGCIIHCAGKAHIMNGNNKKDTYHTVNTEGTIRLAKQAVEVGVKRFIFLSSVKVNGENTERIFLDKSEKKKINKIFKNDDIPNPQDFYAKSKFEAEKELWEISKKTGLEVVVMRLPLVYGFGVKGNMLKLIKLINSGIPLPFSLVKNKRSLISVENLVDILIKCIDHPNVTGKTFLVSDGEDLSTADLLKNIGSAMGISVRLFPFPIFLLKLFSTAIGRQREMDRLLLSLQVDSADIKKTLNWNAPLTVKEGIRKMIKGK
tara:strand:- start:3527 stop:4501 length:975 start_codon:yes stop_codon:yes gene_type:complete